MAPVPTPIPLWSFGGVLDFFSSKPKPERLSSESRSGFSSNPVYEENFELRPLTRNGPELSPPAFESYRPTPTSLAPAPRIPSSAPAPRIPSSAPAPRVPFALAPKAPALAPSLVPILVSFVEDSPPQLPGLDFGPVYQVPVWPGAPPPQLPGLDFGPTFQITSWPTSTVRRGHVKRDFVSPSTELVRHSTPPYFIVFALLSMFLFVFLARFSRHFRS